MNMSPISLIMLEIQVELAVNLFLSMVFQSVQLYLFYTNLASKACTNTRISSALYLYDKKVDNIQFSSLN